MYQKARQDAILEILKKEGYLSVQYLTETLHYSTATINRDLNLLKKRGLIKRSYGGVELVEQHEVQLPFRYHRMKREKRMIGHTAVGFVKPGETIFLDASTTTQSMAQYLAEIEGIRVVTNNLAVVMYLSERGVSVVCLGGEISEKPSMLNGEETVLNAMRYHADKMFFASGSVSEDGKIGGGIYNLLHLTMAENSDEIYYLADHDKVGQPADRYLFHFDRVTCVISDYEFSEEVQEKFPETLFVLAARGE